MKKLYKSLLLVFVMLASVISFAACGAKKEIESIYVDLNGEESILVLHESEWKPEEELTIKAVLSNGDEIDVDAEDCEFSGVDTDITGEQTLKVVYNTYEVEVTVVVQPYLKTIEVSEGLPKNVDHHANNDVYSFANGKIRVNKSNSTHDIVDLADCVVKLDGVVVTQGSTATVGNHTLTIEYEGLTVDYTYTVNKVLTGIELNTTGYSTKVKWSSTGEYDYSAIKAVATYSDSSTKELTYSDLTVVESTKIKMNQKGNQKFTVSYEGLTDESETVEVYVDFESLNYVSGLTSFEYGTNLSTLDIVVEAVFTDNTKQTITEGLVFNYDKTVVGEDVPVTISYTIGSTTKTTQAVNVEIYEVAKNLIVEGKTPTSIYFLKDSIISKDNFNFFVQYSKNKVAVTDIANVTFTPNSFDAVGEKDVTFSYAIEGYNNPFTSQVKVNIIETWDEVPNVEISSIAIKSGLDNEHAHNATIDPSNIVVEVTYSNGSKIDFDYDSQEMTFTFDHETVGNQTFTLTYEGKTATQTINVKRVFVGVAVKNGTTLSALYNANNTVDLTNVKLVATYSNGAVEVNASECNSQIVMNKESLKQSHEYNETITFTYIPTDCIDKTETQAKTCSTTVRVYENVESLTISGKQTVDFESTGNYSELNNNEVQISAIYTSGNVDVVDNYSVVTDVNLNQLGKQNFVVAYSNKQATLEVEVKDVITGYTVEGIKSAYIQDATIDYSQIKLVPIWKSGKVASDSEKVTDGFTYQEIAKDGNNLVAGNHNFVVTYLGEDYSTNVTILNYLIEMVSAPYLLREYNSNSQRQDTYASNREAGIKGFADTGNTYIVGDDNAFIFKPEVQVSYSDGEIVVADNFVMQLKAYLFDGSIYNELTSNLSTYLTYNPTTHALDFEDEAIKKQFKLEFTVDGFKEDDGGNIVASKTTYTMTVEVVDGYNAYTAADLALIDNSHIKYQGYVIANKWAEKRTENGIDVNLTTNAVILHSNIAITKDDIPSIHFLTKAELEPFGYKEDEIGAMKDSDATDPNEQLNTHYVYLRTVSNGESFDLHGNYFQIDIKDLPLVKRQWDSDNRDIGKRPSDDAGLSVHTKLIGIISDIDIKDLDIERSNAFASVNNIDTYGNSKKQDDVTQSGGISFVEVRNINFTAYNTLSQAFYMAYQFTGNEDFSQAYEENGETKYPVVINLKKVNAYDSYNTLIYIYGVERLHFDSCNLIGAGGPVMICDHADVSDDDQGYVTNVYVDQNLKEYGYTNKSVLESWVVGTEGWFVTYGATGHVSLLKSVDPLVRALTNPVFDAVGQGAYTGYRTIIKSGTFGGSSVDFINLVAVYKSTGYGTTSRQIKGSFNVYGYDASNNIEEKGHLNFQDEAILAAKEGTGACILQSYNNGTQGVAVPTGAENPPFVDPAQAQASAPAFATSNDYLNIYLFDGMAAVLGLGQTIIPIPQG